MWITEPSYTADQIRRIRARTLIIVGDKDIVMPEHAVEMFRAISNAQLCVIPGGEHGVMPSEAVLRFLQGSPEG